MSIHELRDLDEARRFILQGLWLQRRLSPPVPGNVRTYLEWALEIASSGEPLPPVGFVADIGVEAFDMVRGEARPRGEPAHPGLSSSLARTYEDHVLGKIYADWTFERARDALKGYAPGKEQARGLAFLITQFRQHAQFDGVLLPPSIIRSLMEASPEDTLRRGLESLQSDGLMPFLEQCYQSMVDASRRTAEVLTEADVRALENRIALADEGQQLAHDLAIRAMIELRNAVPQNKVKPLAGRHEVPTRVLDEDTYPVGGFTSIATRGSIESLLHSQLAFMEREHRPDLFDIKYVRDELYYYSRDENQFLRRRRAYVFALYPDLVKARFKDPQLGYQRIVLILGLILACVQKLTDWLSADALRFDFVFLHDEGSFPLKHEYELLEMLFREQIENQTVHLYPRRSSPNAAARKQSADSFADARTEDRLIELCQERSQRHLCHLVTVSAADHPLQINDAAVARLIVNQASPTLAHEFDETPDPAPWPEVFERLLQLWI